MEGATVPEMVCRDQAIASPASFPEPVRRESRGESGFSFSPSVLLDGPSPLLGGVKRLFHLRFELVRVLVNLTVRFAEGLGHLRHTLLGVIAHLLDDLRGSETAVPKPTDKAANPIIGAGPVVFDNLSADTLWSAGGA